MITIAVDTENSTQHYEVEDIDDIFEMDLPSDAEIWVEIEGAGFVELEDYFLILDRQTRIWF